MTADHFQNGVIGCGVGGKTLGWTLAGQGQKTVVVERAIIGGSCVNIAGLPSKNGIFHAPDCGRWTGRPVCKPLPLTRAPKETVSSQ
jgi:hypothetical protein